MGFLQRVQTSQFVTARRSMSQQPPSAGDDYWYSPLGYTSSSGVRVSTDAALTLSAVWQGVRLIAEAIAGFPCQMHRRVGEDGRERLRGHPLAYRLRWQPNGWQTSFDLWRQVASCVTLRGLFLAELKPGPATGFADAIVPIHPDLVTPTRLPNGAVVYEVRQQAGPPRKLFADEAFAVRGYTAWDGVTPMSVIQFAAQSIGTAIAADRYAGQFFKQGASPAIVVTDKGELGPEGIKNLHESVMAYVGGLKNAFGVLPLEGDVDIKTIGINPHDAQLILTRQFGVEDVARWLNVPLHLLRYSQQGAQSYASVEVFSAEFVSLTLQPLATAIEQSIQRDLLRPLERDDLFVEFNMDALLRGDLKSRYEAYRVGIMSGFLRRTEARIKENLPPAAGLDEFWTPMNVGANVVDRSSDARGHLLTFGRSMADQRAGYRMFVLAQEAAGRIVRREKAAVEALARKHANDGLAWASGLREFYTDHAGFVAETLHVPLAAARDYAAKQGTALQQQGVGAMADWDWAAADELAFLALDGGAEAA